jgi:hypothetical protein
MPQDIKRKQDSGERVVTPLDVSGRRLRFQLSDVVILSGALDVRKLGKQARVRIGASVYGVYGCPCDLEDCNCDAYMVPVQHEAA